MFDRAASGREAECKWNYEAQWDMFRHGLADRIIN